MRNLNFKFYVIVANAAFMSLLSLVTCGKNPTSNEIEFTGMIEIRARIVNPPVTEKSLEILRTLPNRLVVEVSGTDLAPMRIYTNLDFSRPSVVDTIHNVPVGNNRHLSIWAIDADGNITHIDTLASRSATILANTATPVIATLIPAQGSINISLFGLTSDQIVRATFSDGEYNVIVEREFMGGPQVYFSLDNITHGQEGVLIIEIVDYATGEVLNVSTNYMTFSARGDNHIDLTFVNAGGKILLDVNFNEAGVTNGLFDFGNTFGNNTFGGASDNTESGELIVTEIMWHAAGENYIELYNPSNSALSFDTLRIDIVNTSLNIRRFVDVNFEPRSFLVFGRSERPSYVDHSPTTQQTLSMTTSAHVISVRRKDGALIDRVSCANRECTALGWPTAAASPASTIPRRSIELLPEKYDALENNLGKNWRFSASSEPIEGVTSTYTQLGTPGRGPQE